MVTDPVAEITISKNNINDVYTTVEKLSDVGITSDITVLDIAKNKYYDFSNVTDKNSLVPKNDEVKKLFKKLKDSNLKIHMKDTLLDEIYKILPANLKCSMGLKNLTSVTVDSDGSLRLCLRIRGIDTPNNTVLEMVNGVKIKKKFLITI